jgi:hypothetical protein
MADNETLAGMLGDGTKSFLEYMKKAPGAAVDWLAGGAQAGAQPTLAMMQPGAADQPFLPTADGGGRLGLLASALTAPMTPMAVPKGGMVLGAGPAVRRGKSAPVPDVPFEPSITPQGAQMWHVTTPEAATSIRGEGFRPSASGEIGPGVYVIDSPDALTDSRFAGGERLNVNVNAPLLQVRDGTNRPLQVLRGLYGPAKGNEVYDQSRGQLFGPGGLPNWDYLQGLVRDAGHGGIQMTDHGSAKNTVVFDPQHAKVMNSRAPAPHAPQTDEQKRAAIAELLRNGGT